MGYHWPICETPFQWCLPSGSIVVRDCILAELWIFFSVETWLHICNRLWSDWTDAQAHLSLRSIHSNVVGFVMSWLNYRHSYLSRSMWFPTMWYFDKCRLRRAHAASFKTEKLQMMFGQLLNSHSIFKRQAKALIRLRVCAGWSEALLVALTTLLEISCRGSFYTFRFLKEVPYLSDAETREGKHY